PALFMWGMSPDWLQLTVLAMAGGLIGVLFMVPLRRYLIKKEHGKLPYPEGMACAEVLVAAERGGQQASGVFWGIGFGMFFKLLTSGFKVLNGKFVLPLIAKAEVAISVSPALTGVGYILGIRIASVMVGGAALSALVIIPLINWFGAGLTQPFYPETEALIRDMSAHDIWNRYVRYIGAGAVACGGLITLIKSIPTMIESFRVGFAQLRKTGEPSGRSERTDRDLSFKVVIGGILVVLVVLTVIPGVLGFIDSIAVRALAAALIGIFAFFFVTVSSRIVGLVGVTSNPTSGMTIATLLATSLIFAAAGWTDTFGKATALMVGTLSDERSARTTELHEAHVGVVEVLSKYLQSTNSAANNRSRRIAQLCQEVAESLKLSKDDIDNVRIAALMRDMENIEITARVIRKAVDNLGQNRDSDEHTFHGSDLVHSLGAVLTGAFPLVQDLHESNDQFPDGSPARSHDAAGSPIPFGSQIIRAVFAYDALIRGGWGQAGGTPRDAITLLQNDAQTNYHPMVLDHLQRIVTADEPALPVPPDTAPKPELVAAAD
ncbi:MAG: OPT/YSL family transporter, partial [Planctomycetes bacterium]|nr:OPT/YSL family transporter [Planctomycetota bacterium]